MQGFGVELLPAFNQIYINNMGAWIGAHSETNQIE